MNREKIESTFLRLVAEGREGFTLDLEGNEYRPERGFAVKSYKSMVEAIVEVQPHQFIGWWVHDKTKEEFIEVVEVLDSLAQAIFVGHFRNQKAIYDFEEDSTIDIECFTCRHQPTPMTGNRK